MPDPVAVEIECLRRRIVNLEHLIRQAGLAASAGQSEAGQSEAGQSNHAADELKCTECREEEFKNENL